MARSRTSSDAELLVTLDRGSTEPLHRQLEAALRERIRHGRLAATTGPPSPPAGGAPPRGARAGRAASHEGPPPAPCARGPPRRPAGYRRGGVGAARRGGLPRRPPGGCPPRPPQGGGRPAAPRLAHPG